MPTNKLIAYFDQYLTLEEAAKKELCDRVVEKKAKRRQFILQEGEICKHYNFVVEGCLKMYNVDQKGTAHNLQFAIENDWMSDIGSFHSEKPSTLYIEAMEPSLLLRIEKNDLLFLYENQPVFNHYFRVIIEDKFVEIQNRLLQNISSTAEERYLSFLAQYPNISNRIPNTQIASYLGITPEFLSKVRKMLANK